MYIDKKTLSLAIADLKGSANHMIKIWLALKAMGLKAAHPVEIDTKNSKPALDLLFNSGDPRGSYYVPFDSSPRWATMKGDAARSVVQTNIQKWMKHKIVGCDPLGYLDIKKVGVKYRVSVRTSYPKGLGEGKNGFANEDQGTVAIPMTQFAVWVLVRREIPDGTLDVAAYLKNELGKLLHLTAKEKAKVFSNGVFNISTQAEPLKESEIWATCSGQGAVELNNDCRQLIIYGAPGTGKSFNTDKNADGKTVIRTTFHPDSDYSAFVGAYKPTMKGKKIAYEFRPQAFMNAYVAAWKAPTKPVVLVIEEINRGNCAQIFGDLFQLLDRDERTGYSTYPIDADTDLTKWLAEAGRFGASGLAGIDQPECIKSEDWSKVLKGAKLALPPNLYIWATMNTSDQSLFPIDSAFKRRWDWQYVPIAKPDKDADATWRDRAIQADGKYYDWWKFISILNHYIRETTKSEDKQLGYFFVKAPDVTGVITAKQFVNKVLFYLFGDVFKDWELPAAVFERDATSHEKYAFKDFFHDGSVSGHKAGEVKEDEVAKFIKHLMLDGKGVTELTEAPKTNGEKASASAASAAGTASATTAVSADQA